MGTKIYRIDQDSFRLKLEEHYKRGWLRKVDHVQGDLDKIEITTNIMKIKLSKSQWKQIGHVAGWIKTASLTMGVVEYNRDTSFDTLFNMSFALCYRLFHQWMDKQDVSYWQEFHSVTGSDTITIDGTNVDAPSGIINFYVDGIRNESLKKILDSIVGFLKENNVVIGELRKETSNMYGVPVIRIPILDNPKGKETDEIPPHIQMANNNAFFIFNNVLGYNKNLWEDNTFDVSELKSRIEYYEGEAKLPEGSSNGELKPEDLQDVDLLAGKKAQSTYNEQQVRDRLGQIKGMCGWAISHGYKQVYLS